ncbi:hypothetical protein ACHAWO_012906 [Cyclotella atomus]|uniref:Plastid lipid-associated protein/fibrillin conserved domain-containing protein n=1 Tax=Cyclotella atomus TaxID=382360 RepID=A0ABD3NIX5_9STRA
MNAILTFIFIAASNASFANAFVSSSNALLRVCRNGFANPPTSPVQLHHESTSLHAKSTNTSKQRGAKVSTAKGFGKSSSPTAIIVDKSYGQTIEDQTPDEAERAMNAFFAQHIDYHPLFREVMSDTISDAALNHLNQDISNTVDTWSSSSYPWSILPPKPTTNTSLSTLSIFLDAWQTSLTEIPMDAFSNIKGGYDLHFLEEGRRTIAVTRFHVADTVNSVGNTVLNDDGHEMRSWEDQLFQLAWSEIGYYYRKDINDDTGSLILLPEGLCANDNDGGLCCLEQVQQFVLEKLIRPMEWLGRSDDWEIVALEHGNVGVRLLYKLGEIPDLKEKHK